MQNNRLSLELKNKKKQNVKKWKGGALGLREERLAVRRRDGEIYAD